MLKEIRNCNYNCIFQNNEIITNYINNKNLHNLNKNEEQNNIKNYMNNISISSITKSNNSLIPTSCVKTIKIFENIQSDNKKSMINNPSIKKNIILKQKINENKKTNNKKNKLNHSMDNNFNSNIFMNLNMNEPTENIIFSNNNDDNKENNVKPKYIISNMSTEYLDNMEIILKNLKIEGFQKYNKKIKENKKKKENLQKSVDNLKKEILSYNHNKKSLILQNKKIENDIKKMRSISLRLKHNNYLIDKEQQSIPHNNNEDLISIKERTLKMEEEIIKKQNEIINLQNNIKLTNKKINEKKLQIKKIKESIHIIKNHSHKIYLKLEHLEKNNQEVLYNIGKIYLKEFKNYK